MKVAFAVHAQRQARTVVSWWRRHRSAAPQLFEDELDALVLALAAGQTPGSAYPGRVGVRRALLPRSRYHVYYEAQSADFVVVLAVWHTARGRAPKLD